MPQGFISPINSKSSYQDITNVSDILFFNRDVGAFAVATYSEVSTYESVGGKSGVLLQNRGPGNLYMWYGQVPTAIRTVTEFKKKAFIVRANDTFEPIRTQCGITYMAIDASVTLHLMNH